MENQPGLSRELRIMLGATCFIVIIAGMQASAAILVPFLLSVLIAIICTPPLLWMQSKKVPKLLAVTLIMVFLIGVGYFLVTTVGGYVADFTEKLSDNQDSLFEESSSLVEFLQKHGIDISEEIGENFDPSKAIDMTTWFLAGLIEIEPRNRRLNLLWCKNYITLFSECRMEMIVLPI